MADLEGSVRAREGSGAMFDAIAARYDLLNRVLSLGIDRRWRRRTVDALGLAPGARVLDLATGTADLALLLHRRAQADVIGVDPSHKMLAVAARKVGVAGAAVRLACGEAEHLPFAEASFDAVTIAFGIRNVADRSGALAEMRRVTRIGGRVAILELIEPRGALARFHVHTVVPRIGAALSRAPQYRYLEQSIARFPTPALFAEELRKSGWEVERVAPQTLGACCLFVAARR